jgi:hypothetical protein
MGVARGMKLKSPVQIYAEVGGEIDRILEALQVTSSHRDVADVLSTLRDLLGGVQQELDERLDSLREHGNGIPSPLLSTARPMPVSPP